MGVPSTIPEGTDHRSGRLNDSFVHRILQSLDTTATHAISGSLLVWIHAQYLKKYSLLASPHLSQSKVCVSRFKRTNARILSAVGYLVNPASQSTDDENQLKPAGCQDFVRCRSDAEATL